MDELVRKNERQEEFLKNMDAILREDFTRELEERNKFILDGFLEKLTTGRISRNRGKNPIYNRKMNF